MRPTAVGAAGVLHTCQGETTSATYADMYTLPDAETATPGQKESTRRAAGWLNALPSGCVTGKPSATRTEASMAGRIGTGLLQVMPPSVDMLHTAAAWQCAYTIVVP